MSVQPVECLGSQDPPSRASCVACGGAYGELLRNAPCGEVDPVGRCPIQVGQGCQGAVRAGRVDAELYTGEGPREHVPPVAAD
eukprot:2934913-Rhodomonas_salina.1